MTNLPRVFGWTADEAGCAWYRIKMPFSLLGPYATTAYGTALPADVREICDIIVGQRICLPGPSAIWQRLAARPKRPKLIYEIDDNLFQVDETNLQAKVFFEDPERRANIRKNLQVADVVTVTTGPLAEVVRRYNKNVVVIPNFIPESLLAWQPGYYTDRITIGWQGSPTHDVDWKDAAEPVQKYFETKADDDGFPIEMHAIGVVPNTFPTVRPLRITKWMGHIMSYYRSHDWQIALAPLADIPFNRSKSPLRVMEAAALGFPVVASAVGPYRSFVQDGQTGLLVHEPDDWGRHLKTLVEDEDLREQMSANARAQAARLTCEQNVARWKDAYGL